MFNTVKLNESRIELSSQLRQAIKDKYCSSFDRRKLHIARAILKRNPSLWDIHHEKIDEYIGHEINTIYLVNKESGRKVFIENKSINSSTFNFSKMAFNNAMKIVSKVLEEVE